LKKSDPFLSVATVAVVTLTADPYCLAVGMVAAAAVAVAEDCIVDFVTVAAVVAAVAESCTVGFASVAAAVAAAAVAAIAAAASCKIVASVIVAVAVVVVAETHRTGYYFEAQYDSTDNKVDAKLSYTYDQISLRGSEKIQYDTVIHIYERGIEIDVVSKRNR
jgi:hypothetical protein